MAVKCPKCDTENPSDSKYCKECATQLPSEEVSVPTKTLEAPKEELTTGSTFADRYQIIEELGKGGMGKVYKAVDKEINGKVALKLIKPEIAADGKTIERFRNELKTARDIAHKNVCRMYHLAKHEGTHYIVMEYVSGEDLKSFIRRSRQVTPGTAISIAKQVCEGLSEAHKLGTVHRDLKPQNIMIDKEGNARIMDFGIARSLKEKGITGAGVMIGTPEYMSPEQVEAKEVDQRSDIYSLGVILYEMVTGRVPFEADTPFAIGVKHKSETPKDPREINSQIPEDLSKVILRCLEKEKEKRYQSSDELHSELTKIEKGIPFIEKIVPERRPSTSKEITVTFELKKLLIPAVVIVAIVIAAVVIWQLLPEKAPIPIPSGKPSLAVLYFENNTGDEKLEHYRKALSDLLIADLSQSKYINVLRGDRLFNILNQLDQLEAESYSSDVLKEVAIRGRTTHILQGNYTKAGEIFRINIMLHEASTEELVGSEIVEGRGEESIFSMVDELTKRIKASLKLSAEQVASDIDKQIGKITTNSPEAYKYYMEARRYHDLPLDMRKAIEFYKKAIAIDPEFGTAYRSMAAAYSNLGYSSEWRKYIQKAMELSDRVSDRELYQTQAYFYRQTEKTYDKALAAHKKLIELYPEYATGYNSLGNLYRSLEEWDKAIEQYNVPIQNKSDNSFPYGNVAVAYRAKGSYEKAIKVIEDYLNNFTEIASFHWSLAETYRCQGRYDLALIEIDEAFSLAPTHFANFIDRGDIYLYKGDLVKAEEEYQRLLENKEPVAKARGMGLLAGLYLLQGRFKDSREKIKEGLELARKIGEKARIRGFHSSLSYLDSISGNYDQSLKELSRAWESAVEDEDLGSQRSVLYNMSLIYIEMKSMEEAMKTADKLKQMIEHGMHKKAIKLHHHLMGMIELKKRNYSKAIEFFHDALPLVRANGPFHMILSESLASAYNGDGDLDKAQKEYEKMASLNAGRLEFGDLYAKSFYRLGKIYEQKGWKGKAIEQYGKFLDLWKDADPGIDEVEDAKKRLAELQGQ